MKKTLFRILCIVLTFGASTIAHAKLSDETQAGIVVTNGNSHTQTYNVTNKTRYDWQSNSLEFSANYLRAVNSGALSSLNWLLGLRYERALSERFSAFLGETLEGDQFAGVLQRYNTDLGAKYYLRKLDKDFVWFAEGGYRFTKEHNTNGLTKNYQKARLYTEAEKYWSPVTSTKVFLEYIPNFTVSEQWLLNAEASVSSALNSVFAVKTAYGLRYNNAPVIASAQKADTTFSTSLVAKF